ncbi:hypothetical protein AUK10_00465 [Candidatus Gracilibacteria bacterium CG2_30_37_12]|nr:MAG: hypothetical protein AUK10_00465 [Candidatus Gracilibacteria bacterium CG2_30_37_12]
MTDIYTIKNLLHFLPYLKEETWYMIGIGIIVYVIYIGYFIAFERYYKMQNNLHIILPEEKSIDDLLGDLKIDDVDFFERLSFIIRSHLEDSEQVPLATKKTPKDIHGKFVSKEFQKILTECMHAAYAEKGGDNEMKKKLIEKVRKII